MKIIIQRIGRPNPTNGKHTMNREFINKLQYDHRVTSNNIHHYPNQTGLRFCGACVLGAFMFLAIVTKIKTFTHP